MKLLVAIVLMSLAGCSAAPYFEIGAGYRIDENSDWYLRGERQWTGRNPITDAELGLEFERWLNAVPSCGYYHWSSILDGGFNSNAELYEDRLRCSLRWGGK